MKMRIDFYEKEKRIIILYEYEIYYFAFSNFELRKHDNLFVNM
jgi:hypothetical protein